MKQTDAWDLTCRPLDSHALPQSSPAPTGLMLQPEQVTAISLAANLKLNSIAGSVEPARTQFIVPSISSLSSPTFIWNTLSSGEQLQALLATASRAATLSGASQRNDLVSPLDWLSVPPKTDLNPQLPLNTQPIDYKGPALATGNPLSSTNLSSNFTTSETCGHLVQTLGVAAVRNEHPTGCPIAPLSSSSPISSASSDHSSGSCGSTARVVEVTKSLNKTKSTTRARESKHKDSSSRSSRTSTRLASSSSETELSASGEAINVPIGLRTDLRLDRRARKKDQNRRAAYNYRRKKMEERDRMIEEEARLVHKHVRLAGKIAGLERKIMTILSTKTAKIVDKDGQIVYYSCPFCLKYCSKNIQTLRKHLKVQHLQCEMLDRSDIGSPSRNCLSPPLDYGNRSLNDIEYDSCIDSDEANDFDNVDPHKDYGRKFVIGSSLEGDYSTTKKGHSP